MVLEKELEKKLVARLSAKRCLVYKFVSPGNAGVPDRIVVAPDGAVYFVELKAKGKRPRPMQLYQMDKLKRNNANVRVVDDEEGINTLLFQMGILTYEQAFRS